MSVLNSQQTLDFKVRLRQRAAQLRHEIQRVLEKSTQESHARIAELARDVEDDSFSNLIVDLNYSEIDRDVQELRRIDSALSRLTGGSYGLCIDCDQPIPMPRMLAEPTASRCIGCQELFEKTHATDNTPSL